MSQLRCRANVPSSDPTRCIPWYPRIEPALPCVCTSPQSKWCSRNYNIIQLLANALNQPVRNVCTFLFELTLNLFNRILNPLVLGYKMLKVPFVLTDTCELYYGIFDENGDLRRPMSMKPFLLLLIMMKRILCLPCRLMRPRDRCGHSPIMYCKKGMGLFINPLFGATRAAPPKVSASDEVRAGLRRLGLHRSGSQDSLDSDDMPYGYAPRVCKCRGSGQSGPLPIAQRPTPGHMLSPSELQQACEKECIESGDNTPPKCKKRSLSAGKIRRLQIKVISKYYEDVTQSKYNPHLFDGLRSKPKCDKTNHRRAEGGHMPMQMQMQKDLKNETVLGESPHSIQQRIIRAFGGYNKNNMAIDEDHSSFNNGFEVQDITTMDSNQKKDTLDDAKETTKRINPYMDTEYASDYDCLDGDCDGEDGLDNAQPSVEQSEQDQPSTGPSILTADGPEKGEKIKTVRFNDFIRESSLSEQSQRNVNPRDHRSPPMEKDARRKKPNPMNPRNAKSVCEQPKKIPKRRHPPPEKDVGKKRARPGDNGKPRTEPETPRQQAGSMNRIRSVEDEIKDKLLRRFAVEIQF